MIKCVLMCRVWVPCEGSSRCFLQPSFHLVTSIEAEESPPMRVKLVALRPVLARRIATSKLRAQIDPLAALDMGSRGG